MESIERLHDVEPRKAGEGDGGLLPIPEVWNAPPSVYSRYCSSMVVMPSISGSQCNAERCQTCLRGTSWSRWRAVPTLMP